MNALEFLQKFTALDDFELNSLRYDAARLESCCIEPSLYVSYVHELFLCPPTDEIISRDEPFLHQRHRLLCLLIELLYYDGRTFEAMMAVAECAFEYPDTYFVAGVNALGCVSNYLSIGGVTRESPEDLIARFDRLASNCDLRHNATNCLNLLQRRLRDSGSDRTIG